MVMGAETNSHDHVLRASIVAANGRATAVCMFLHDAQPERAISCSRKARLLGGRLPRREVAAHVCLRRDPVSSLDGQSHHSNP